MPTQTVALLSTCSRPGPRQGRACAMMRLRHVFRQTSEPFANGTETTTHIPTRKHTSGTLYISAGVSKPQALNTDANGTETREVEVSLCLMKSTRAKAMATAAA